jgi:hypothetical protein
VHSGREAQISDNRGVERGWIKLADLPAIQAQAREEERERREAIEREHAATASAMLDYKDRAEKAEAALATARSKAREEVREALPSREEIAALFRRPPEHDHGAYRDGPCFGCLQESARRKLDNVLAALDSQEPKDE